MADAATVSRSPLAGEEFQGASQAEAAAVVEAQDMLRSNLCHCLERLLKVRQAYRTLTFVQRCRAATAGGGAEASLRSQLEASIVDTAHIVFSTLSRFVLARTF